MIKNNKMDCPKCGGLGKIDLPTELLEIKDLIKSSGPATPKVIFFALRLLGNDISRTAIHNRLERLRRTGLVTRQLSGREYVYSVKEY